MSHGQISSDRNMLHCLFAVLLSVSMLFLAACGQGSSSTEQPAAGSADQQDQQGGAVGVLDEGDEEDPEVALAPLVNAGPDQFADANVVVALTGTAEAQAEASISSVQWQQLTGPSVTIANVNELSNIINVPDTIDPDLLIFSLSATDSEGRSSEDVVVINVLPLEVFARVISTSVDESVGTALIRVELSAPSANDTFITLRTIDGSATSGSDYVAVDREVIIPAGQSSVEVPLEVVDDILQEADETLLVQIAVENGDIRNTGNGSVIIRNGGDVATELLPQTIAFTTAGPLEGNVGETITNVIIDDPVSAPGIGPVTYRSSNPLVASVDGVSGEVNLLAPGIAVITALKDADNIYAAAQTSYNLTVNLLAQELAFTEPGPLSGQVNDVISNPLANTGLGTGDITITSSNTELATVSADTGEVTLLSPGLVTITATRAADEVYAQAQASYDINIGLLLQILEFSLPGPVDGEIGQIITNPLANEGDGSGAITYSADNTDIALVDALTGEVELLALGTAVITATKAADNTYAEAMASYTIVVRQAAQALSFSAESVQLGVGETLINAVLDSPGTGTVAYSSADPGIVSVNAATGEIEALAVGTTAITAVKAADNTIAEATGSYQVSVVLRSQILTFEDVGPVNAFVGTNLNNPLVNEGEGTGDILFSSSMTDVATVDPLTGLVNPLAVGSAVITATKAADNTFAEASASYTVEVLDGDQVFRFTELEVTAFIGDIFTNEIIDIGNGTGAVTYVSSNTQVASVGITSGVVVASTLGSAIINASKESDEVFDNSFAEFTINVVLQPQTLAFANPGPIQVNFGVSTFSNPLDETGFGTGEITFESSNENVAFYDDDEVIIQSVGTTIITATKAADNIYDSAQVSFTFTVLDDPR